MVRSFRNPGFTSLLVICVGFLAPLSARAETIELVTYYPAPGGGDVDTDRLHAGRATIGNPPYSLTNPANLPYGTLLVAGPVGIGTADPQLPFPQGSLHVHSEAGQGALMISGASDAGSTWSAVYLDGSLADNGANRWTLAFRNQAGTPQQNQLQFVYWPDPATALAHMAVLPNGNVGIGTVAPMNALDVVGVIGAGAAGRQLQTGVMVPGGSAAVGFWADLRSGTDNSAANSLPVRGAAIAIDSFGAGGRLHLSGNRTSAAQGATFDPLVAPNAIMTLTLDSGNVGIGNTAPTAAASPGNNQAEGNLDVNDVFLRSVNRWASQTPRIAQVSLAADMPYPTGTSAEKVLLSVPVTTRGGPLFIHGKVVSVSPGVLSHNQLRIRRDGVTGAVLDQWGEWTHHAAGTGVNHSAVLIATDARPAGTYTYVLTGDSDNGIWTARGAAGGVLTKLIVTEF